MWIGHREFEVLSTGNEIALWLEKQLQTYPMISIRDRVTRFPASHFAEAFRRKRQFMRQGFIEVDRMIEALDGYEGEIGGLVVKFEGGDANLFVDEKGRIVAGYGFLTSMAQRPDPG